MRLFTAFAFALSGLVAPAFAGPELAGQARQSPEGVAEDGAARRPAAPSTTYAEIRPDAVYAGAKPAPIAHTYGTRRYAGRVYMIVPGQWYPPVWEDECAVKRTCAIPGVAPWPGVRVDVNSDEVPLAPVGPPPVPMICAPPAPRTR